MRTLEIKVELTGKELTDAETANMVTAIMMTLNKEAKERGVKLDKLIVKA